MDKKDLSIVSPMHNEELNVELFLSRTDKVLKEMSVEYEILIVNDGSTDNTPALLKEAVNKISNLRVVSLAKNSGQWAAIYAGMQLSKGEYVIVMDSDLQNPPEDIPRLYAKAGQGYDLVSGVRKKRSESLFLKRIPSKIANMLLRKTTGCPSKDMGGCKCIHGDVARKLHLRAGQHRFLPALVWNLGGTVADIDVQFPPRQHGKSHYGFSRAFDVFFDILLFWFEGSFKARPVYMFGRISILIFLISLFSFSWVVYQKIFMGIPLTQRPFFYVGLVGMLSSFVILSFGFVLEQLADVQKSVRDRYPFMISEEISS